MSEARFTKGPWHWIGDMCIEGQKGETVLECGDDGKEWGLHSAELRISDADRVLIAAAPDLLEAARMTERLLRVGNGGLLAGCEAHQALIVAIAKAEGK